MEQSTPWYPGSQVHTPSWHSPTPLQSFGQLPVGREGGQHPALDSSRPRPPPTAPLPAPPPRHAVHSGRLDRRGARMRRRVGARRHEPSSGTSTAQSAPCQPPKQRQMPSSPHSPCPAQLLGHPPAWSVFPPSSSEAAAAARGRGNPVSTLQPASAPAPPSPAAKRTRIWCDEARQARQREHARAVPHLRPERALELRRAEVGQGPEGRLRASQPPI